MAPAPKQPDLSTYSGRFAARLRSLREKAGLTVEQLASDVNEAGHSVAVRSIYNWEQGTTSPPINAFPALAKAYRLKSTRAILPDE
jgi:transcriptional regulator with XRE-family HTH domain